AKLDGKSLGEFSDALCYSFYPSKNLGALGDGGFVASNDSELIQKINILRNCGQKEKNYHTEVGFNSRLDNLQAAYLQIKLKKLDEWNQSRRQIAKRYQEYLQELDEIKAISETKKGENVYHIFGIRTRKRKHLINTFQKNQIQYGIHYPVPINRTEAYKNFNFSSNHFPVSEQASKEIISIPIFPYMRDDEINRVIDAIKQV
ncbi:MAG: DegT/DnrJ/EryC1/StrS family aminotransferase, partial [Candidatus Hodarchaeota archaeon]